MSTIGITGHALLSRDSEQLIKAALGAALREDDAPHGITCLAPGADQLFAEAVLEAGGTFEVILPAPDYRDTMVALADRPAFDRLLSRASSISFTKYARSEPDAFLAASKEVVRRSSRIIAVWDGTPTGTVGDTAQVVDVARAAGLPVQVIWPHGARRSV